MRRTLLLYLSGIIAAVVALCITLYSGMARVEANALSEAATHLGVAPTKTALRQHVVELLEARRGAPRAEIHALLEESLTDYTFRIGTRGSEREDVYWTMGYVPWGHLWTVFLLKYDSNGRLESVSTGSS